MTQPLTIGSKVQRLAAQTDYTNGRTGEIIEVNYETKRFRVFWTKEKDGRDVKNGRGTVGVRTWVAQHTVMPL